MTHSRRRANRTTHYASFKDPDGKWVKERVGPSKREAERIEAQRKREVAAGTYQVGGSTDGILLETFAQRWFDARTNKTRLDDIQRVRDHVLPRLGRTPMRELRLAACIQLVRDLVGGGMHPKTASNVWGAFRTLLRDAAIAELISFAPLMPRGVIPPHSEKLKDCFTNEEAVTLMTCNTEEAEGQRMAIICLYTGCRRGEACGLTWADWDDTVVPVGSLYVDKQYSGRGEDARTKTRRPRMVPVHHNLAEFLREWSVGCRSEDPIVPHLVPTEHHTRSTARKSWDRLLVDANVRPFGIHRTRHTAITAMRRGGVPVREVEQVTHNSAGTIVDRYTHDWSILAAAVSVIDYLRPDPSRVASRVAHPNTSVKMGITPGSIPGASTSKKQNPREKSGQSSQIGCPNFPGILSSPQSRVARHEIDAQVDRDLAPLSDAELASRRGGLGILPASADDHTIVFAGRTQWPARARLDLGVGL